MNSKIFLAVLMMVVSAFCTMSPPITYQRFSASFQHTVHIDFNAIGHREETLRATVAALGLPSSVVSLANKARNVEQQPPTGVFDLSFGGVITVDTTNNILLQNVGHLGFSANIGGLSTNLTIPVNDTALLYFDLKKNFTWTEQECTCQPISGTSEMVLTYIPPFGKFNTNTTIFINGKPVNVEQWGAQFPVGFVNPLSPLFNNSVFDLDWLFYVQPGTQEVSRVQFAFKTPFASVNATIDMWDVASLNTNSVVLPDSKCAKACQAAVTAVTDFAKCVNSTSKCQCLGLQSFNFCGVIDWPVSTTIFPNISDQYAQKIFQEIQQSMGSVGQVPTQCLQDLKSFLCKFYFPLCGSSQGGANWTGGDFQKPHLSVFACNSTNSRRDAGDVDTAQLREVAYQSAPFSAYMAAEGRTQNYTPDNNGGSSGLEGWKIALIVIGSVVGGVMLVGIVAVYMKKRRGNYSAL